jgi:hypothetical protein
MDKGGGAAGTDTEPGTGSTTSVSSDENDNQGEHPGLIKRQSSWGGVIALQMEFRNLASRLKNSKWTKLYTKINQDAELLRRGIEKLKAAQAGERISSSSSSEEGKGAGPSGPTGPRHSKIVQRPRERQTQQLILSSQEVRGNVIL